MAFSSTNKLTWHQVSHVIFELWTWFSCFLRRLAADSAQDKSKVYHCVEMGLILTDKLSYLEKRLFDEALDSKQPIYFYRVPWLWGRWLIHVFALNVHTCWWIEGKLTSRSSWLWESIRRTISYLYIKSNSPLIKGNTTYNPDLFIILTISTHDWQSLKGLYFGSSPATVKRD